MAEKKRPATPAPKRRTRPPTGAAAGPSFFNDASDAQNRLLEAQATIERDYARLREVETLAHYLLQSSSDGLLLVDGTTRRVVDANPAACRQLQQPRETLVGRAAGAVLEGGAAARLGARLDALIAGADVESFAVTLAEGGRGNATPSLFRRNGTPLVAIRLESTGRVRPAAKETTLESRMGDYLLAAPDAIVLTDRDGLVLQANGAFVELIQVATEKQVRGVSLGRWLGRTSVDLGVLVTNLRQRGTLKLFSTQLRAEYGSLSDVEISAAAVGDGPDGCLGFTIRDVGRRLPTPSGRRNDLPKSVDQMSELVGRVPMKDIVGNASGLIEQMCIKAALDLTRDNRAAAAELLGISRQSLYVKLRRFGLIGPDDGETPDL